MSFFDHDGTAPDSHPSPLFAEPREHTVPPSHEDPAGAYQEPVLRHRRGADDAPRTARVSAADHVRHTQAAHTSQASAPSTSASTSRVNSSPTRRRTGSSQRRARLRARVRILARVLLFAAVVATVALLGGVLYFRHVMRAALPEIDGTVQLSGLNAAVTISRDEHGVPSIHGGSLDDLLIAQGYVTAQDRLWQMDSLRRHAAGELAEVLGSSLVDHDRQQRVLQMRSAADRAIAAMPDTDRHQLEMYARGVNRFIDTHSDRLPVEFRLLHYSPAPWQPRDSLLVTYAMWQDLTTGFPVKLQREALAHHLPAALLGDLYPVSSFRDRPPTQQPEDLTTPKPSVLQIPLDSTQYADAASARDLLARSAALSPLARCNACRAGSNNWAVGGNRSASGAPLLAGDMHLQLSIPGIWYVASLHASAPSGEPLDVEGFTLPGVPFVIAGRNAHVAWSFTNMGADVQDLYIEHLRGSGESAEFQRADGTWAAVDHHSERIHVRGHPDVVLDVLSTTHAAGSLQIVTPVISPLFPSEHRSVALAWTMYDPSASSLPLFAVNSAGSGVELASAFSTCGLPLNLVWADDARHIGFHALGRIPVRGPADRHPRQLPTLDMDVPATGPPADENSNPDAPENNNPDAPESNPTQAQMQPQAAESRPHLTTVAFGVRAHLEAAAFVPGPASRHRHRVRNAAPGAAKTPGRRPRAAAAPVPPPAPPPIAYTVGGPLLEVPADALSAAAMWSGYVPYEELPSITDPASGVLATANARITADDYPYAIADNWADAYRVARIHRLLDGRSSLTPADLTAVQMDTVSELDRFLAQRLAYALDHASQAAIGNDGTRLRQAADLLRRWDGNVTTSSSAATLTNSFREHAWGALLTPQIRAHDHLRAKDASAMEYAALYNWASSASALEVLLNHQPARWLPAGSKNWDDFLTRTLETSLRDDGAPHDLARWTWGTQHRLAVHHPLLSRRFVGRLLAAHMDPGPKPIPGDEFTVRASKSSFGASQRLVADLSNPDATSATLPGGESGNPDSPWYLDQFPAWLNGTALPLPMSGAGAQHTLTLTP